ncbi:site-2 protease family protein [Protofrankia symbiont of Coriaria ruscifolia]|uniref:site-2 protease family protein n=1 Tax=Protofrankia symbiont of Coriaria ruscifolia TaxID=1306542 RepID=UPI001F5EB29B|nr:site-2 protease family protein [Protofrankia symbiont of Coriaria ruscifolia]
MADQPDQVPRHASHRAGGGEQGGGHGRRPPGMLVGRVRGVPVYLSPLALLFGLIIGVLLLEPNRERLPDVTEGQLYLLVAITSAGFIASLVMHEIGHCLTALGFGLRVRGVTVHGFVGFTEIEPEPQTPAREFLVAAAGPAVNGVLAGAGFALLTVLDSGTQPGVVVLDLTMTNLVLCVFNLLPGLPLDGGRLVVAAVWGGTRDRLRGARAGAYGGYVVAGLLALWALLSPGSRFDGLYLLVVAAFIAVGAHQSLRQAQIRMRLPGVSAGRLARRTLPVEGSVPLAEALRRARELGASAVAVVDSDGTPIKVMTGSAVDALPEHRRPWMTVDEVSRTISPGMVLEAELEGEDLLAAVGSTPATEYLVTQGGRPVGVLAMVDLVARIDPASIGRLANQR